MQLTPGHAHARARAPRSPRAPWTCPRRRRRAARASAPPPASRRWGRAVPRRRPPAPGSPSSRAARAERLESAASYGADMSGKRVSPSRTAPDERIPEHQVDVIADQHQIARRGSRRGSPPAALDTKSVRAPSACATRTGSAAVSAECPSYMWKRPAKASTGTPSRRPERSRCPRGRSRRRQGTRDLGEGDLHARVELVGEPAESGTRG